MKVVPNVVTLGRVLALAVIVAGVAVSAWDATAVGDYPFVAHYQFRSFVGESLIYIWEGGLLLAIAEIAARFGPAEPGGRIDWKLTTLLRVMGVTIIVGGIALIVWNAQSLRGNVAIGSNAILGFSPYLESGSKRVMAHNAIEYGWQGGLLILAAEIADRLRRGGGGEEVIEEPLQPDPTVEAPALPGSRVEQPV